MPTDSESLIRLEQIPEVFSDLAIARAVKRAGLRVEPAMQKRLAAAIRSSVGEYATATRRPTPNTVHRQIANFGRALNVGRGKRERNYKSLAKKWAEMSDEARRMIGSRLEAIREQEMSGLRAWDLFTARHGGQNLRPRPTPVFAGIALPTTADLEDPERQVGAVDLLFRIVVTGRCRKWRLRVHAPTRSRREPRREAERSLVVHLSMDWLNVTGSEPTLTARHGMLGPFAKFVAEVLGLARVPINGDRDHDRQGLTVEILNHLAAERRRRQAERSLRRILNPLRVKHDLVDEIRRLIELGEADVLRISAGADCIHDPRKPALAEFQDAGTICFYRSPRSWRTIAIRPSPRRRIMDIAERIAAVNAGGERARAAAKRRRNARAAAKQRLQPGGAT